MSLGPILGLCLAVQRPCAAGDSRQRVTSCSCLRSAGGLAAVGHEAVVGWVLAAVAFVGNSAAAECCHFKAQSSINLLSASAWYSRSGCVKVVVSLWRRSFGQVISCAWWYSVQVLYRWCCVCCVVLKDMRWRPQVVCTCHDKYHLLGCWRCWVVQCSSFECLRQAALALIECQR